jgi:4-amino-4-deoxy-L-arabinose transferase-like glycosyltransferase
MDWLIAISYRIGGVTEFTTRLPGAFFSACGVPLLYLLARAIFLEQLPAIFAACVYLTLLPVVRHGPSGDAGWYGCVFFLTIVVLLAQKPRR